MEVIKISPDTWRVEDEGVRFFLLAGTERALLIDSGMTVHNAKEIAEELVDVPVELLNTHADMDHTGSNGEFARFYMHPAEAVNYYNGQRGGPRSGDFVPVEDGQVISLGGRTLEAVLIPGHTPGSLAVLDVENRVLYSGDTVQDGTIFMFGPMRELHAFLHSLEKLKGMADRFDQIYPSHGALPVSPALIPALYSAAEAILTGKAEGTDTEFHGMKLKKYDMGCASFLCQA